MACGLNRKGVPPPRGADDLLGDVGVGVEEGGVGGDALLHAAQKVDSDGEGRQVRCLIPRVNLLLPVGVEGPVRRRQLRVPFRPVARDQSGGPLLLL